MMLIKNFQIKFSLASAALLACSLISGGQAMAQEEIALEEVRKQFAAVKAPAPQIDALTTVNDESFAAADTDLDEANQKLLAAEAELLRELQANQPKSAAEGSASANAAIVESADGAAIDTAKASARIGAPAASVSSRAPIIFEDGEIPSADFASQKMHNDLMTQRSQVDMLRAQNADLTKKLAQSEARANQMKTQLDKLRNKLMLSETEVERLSKVLEERNRAGIAAARGQAAQPQAAKAVAAPATVQRTTQTKAQPAPAPDDVPVVTVSADKAYLRTGPGPQNSPLMAVSKGTRLVVETMQGDWYRVITPKGDRAWINREVIFFNNRRGSDVSSGGTLRIQGLESKGTR